VVSVVYTIIRHDGGYVYDKLGRAVEPVELRTDGWLE